MKAKHCIILALVVAIIGFGVYALLHIQPRGSVPGKTASNSSSALEYRS